MVVRNGSSLRVRVVSCDGLWLMRCIGGFGLFKWGKDVVWFFKR